MSYDHSKANDVDEILKLAVVGKSFLELARRAAVGYGGGDYAALYDTLEMLDRFTVALFAAKKTKLQAARRRRRLRVHAQIEQL